MDLSMQMKALRSENFAKLSSSSSTRDEYWVTSISAGTPAGYCLSQMRSMLFPLLVRFPWACPLIGTGRVIWGSIEHCDGRWQAAPRFTRIGHGKSAGPTGESTKCAAQQRSYPPVWPRYSWVWSNALPRPWVLRAWRRWPSGVASGLAFAWLTWAGLAAPDLPSFPVSLASDFASFFSAATRDFFPRCRDVCWSASAATAAIKAAPVLVGPVIDGNGLGWRGCLRQQFGRL